MSDSGVAARRLAIDALVRIEKGGAFANLIVPRMLADSDLAERDRGFVTELVYGTTRMQRACDHLVDRFVMRDVEPIVRCALRVGAYQLAMLETPAHAAVGATVSSVPKRVRGFVNAVLRKVADAPVEYPDDATRLSYPDWIVSTLEADLGSTRAAAMLECMNQPAQVHQRADGYRQDPSSQLIADLVTGDGVVVDLCAAPGGKATAVARPGRLVIAGDLRSSRTSLIVNNRAELDLGDHLAVVIADGTRPPLRPGSADTVIVDAPCSGLGALRRRPDARWRIGADAIDRLAALQFRLLEAATELVKPGGRIVYSVCTVTAAESTAIDDRVRVELPQLSVDWSPADPWDVVGRGGRVLPAAGSAHDGDGMCAFVYRRET